jgi:hypothetical protein
VSGYDGRLVTPRPRPGRHRRPPPDWPRMAAVLAVAALLALAAGYVLGYGLGL